MLPNRFYAVTKTLIHSIALISFLASVSSLHAKEVLSVQEGTEQVYELRGIFEVGNERSFSLFHRPTQQAGWGAVGRTVLDVRLLAYDAETKKLTISHGDSVEVLTLKEADAKPLAINFEPSEKSNKQQYRQANANSLKNSKLGRDAWVFDTLKSKQTTNERHRGEKVSSVSLVGSTLALEIADEDNLTGENLSNFDYSRRFGINKNRISSN